MSPRLFSGPLQATHPALFSIFYSLVGEWTDGGKDKANREILPNSNQQEREREREETRRGEEEQVAAEASKGGGRGCRKGDMLPPFASYRRSPPLSPSPLTQLLLFLLRGGVRELCSWPSWALAIADRFLGPFARFLGGSGWFLGVSIGFGSIWCWDFCVHYLDWSEVVVVAAVSPCESTIAFCCCFV